MRVATALTLVVLLLALSGCRMNERMSGTVFGGIGGAALGGALGGTFVGVLVGGLAGGVAGYIVGDYIADRRERASYAPQQSPYGPPTANLPPGAAPIPRVGAVKTVDTAYEASRAAIEEGRRAETLPAARAAYERAVRLDPRNPDAWNALGLVLHMEGNENGAETSLRRALSLDPNHYAAQRNLAWIQGGVR